MPPTGPKMPANDSRAVWQPGHLQQGGLAAISIDYVCIDCLHEITADHLTWHWCDTAYRFGARNPRSEYIFTAGCDNLYNEKLRNEITADHLTWHWCDTAYRVVARNPRSEYIFTAGCDNLSQWKIEKWPRKPPITDPRCEHVSERGRDNSSINEK